MIVAAHQPNCLPWLGFFDRMRKADLFVLVDHVQFERQNYQNRTRVKTGNGEARWVTVPVRQRSRDERVVDKLIDNDRRGKFRWGRKAYRTIQYSYEGAPYYREHAATLQAVLDARWERLIDLNLTLLEWARQALGIATPVVRSSTLGVEGLKSDMVLDLCRRVGATQYVAGLGGSHGYLDTAAFERAGVEVVWQQFEHPRYEQRPAPGTFVEGLSVLDLILNCGPRSGAVLAGEGVRETARS